MIRCTVFILILCIFMIAKGAIAMEFRAASTLEAPCHKDCSLLFASGNIDQDAVEQFKELDLTGIDTVVLSSDGGNISEALSLGRLIRAQGLSTKIGRADDGEAICQGPCSWAFLGGVSRNADFDTKQLVFERPNHQEILLQLTSKSSTLEERLGEQIIIGTLVNYLADMSVSNELYTRLAKLKVGGTFRPSETEAKALYIIRDRPSWLLEHWQAGLVLTTLAPKGQSEFRVFCRGESQDLHLHVTFETAAPASSDGSHNLCVGTRCLNTKSLPAPGARTKLLLNKSEFPATFGGFFADPIGRQTAVLDFQISDHTFENLRKSSSAEFLGLLAQHPEETTLFKELSPSSEDRFLGLLKRNCT